MQQQIGILSEAVSYLQSSVNALMTKGGATGPEGPTGPAGPAGPGLSKVYFHGNRSFVANPNNNAPGFTGHNGNTDIFDVADLSTDSVTSTGNNPSGGDDFAPSTGIFTAPREGRYLLTSVLNVGAKNASGGPTTPVRHVDIIFSYDTGSGFVDEDESTRFHQDYYNGPFQVTVSQTRIVHLQQNDKVKIRVNCGVDANAPAEFYLGNFTGFTGHNVD
jgi:hypothetical protein